MFETNLSIGISDTAAKRGGASVRGELGKIGRETKQTVNAVDRDFNRLGRTIGTLSGLLASLGVGASFGSMIKQFSDFEKTLSTVKAVTGAATGQMSAMGQEARRLGATTVFSAKQAAEGMAFLGRAGFNATKIIAAMPGTLALATAGALDLGRAADIASNVLTGFGMKAREMNRVADVMAKTAASANTSVEQLGHAMKFAAPLAAGLGVSMETTAAAIGVLSNAGIQAEMAGTGLRMTLTSLSKPTTEAERIFAKYKLTLDEVSPAVVGLQTAIDNMAAKGVTALDAMAIAGARGGSALGVMIANAGGVDSLTKTLQDAAGAAQEMALTMSDNLDGAVRRFGSVASEIGLMLTGDSGLGAGLKDLVNDAASVLQTFTQFSGLLGESEEKYKKIGIAVKVVAASFGVLAAGLTAAKLATMGLTAAMAINPFGLALIAISALIGSLIGLKGEIIEIEGRMVDFGKVWDSIARKLGDGWKIATDQIKSNLGGVYAFWAGTAEKTGRSFSKLIDNMINSASFMAQAVGGIFSAIGDAWGNSMNRLSRLWSGFLDQVMGNGSAAFDSVMAEEFSSGLTEGIEKAIKGASSTFDEQHVRPFFDGLVITITDYKNSVLDSFAPTKGLGDEVYGLLNGMEGLGDATTLAADAQRAAAGAAEEMTDKVRDQLAAIQDEIIALDTRSQTMLLGAKRSDLLRDKTKLDHKAILANTIATIDYNEATERAAIALQQRRLEEEKAASMAPKVVEALDAQIRALDRLDVAMGVAFDAKRADAFAEAQEEAAKRTTDAWTNTTSAINSLFDDLFGGLTDKLGIFGGVVEGVFKDIVGQVLNNNGQTSGGIGGFIVDTVKTVFGSGGKSGGGTGFSFNPASILTNITNALDSGFASVGNMFQNVFGATTAGGSTFSVAGAGAGAGTVAEFGGASAASLAGGTAPTLALSPVALGIGAAAAVVIPALMAAIKNAGDGPAFGARLGVNAGGTLDIADVRTDDGFSDSGAQAIADAVVGFSNSILESSGLRLKEGAFAGEIAFNDRVFKSSGIRANNASGSFAQDGTGIQGLTNDSRQFNNANQAIADFVARNMFLALQEGNLEGLTEGGSDVFRVGLGNMIRRVRDDVHGGEGGLDLFAADLDFLAAFAKYRDVLHETGIAADDAAGRSQAALESQTKYNDALARVREEASEGAVSGLSGLGDFIDTAHRLFDPTGGDETQIRLRLGDARGPNFGMLDAVYANASHGFFDTDNGVDQQKAAEYFDISRLGMFQNPGAENFGPGQGGFSGFGVRFTNTGMEGGAFGEHGASNVFSGGNGDVSFNQPGTGGGMNLTIDATQFVKALTGHEDLDFGEAIMDPIFAAGASLIVESFGVAKKQVDDYFAQFTGESLGANGPLALFEEIVPTVNPLVESLEQFKANLEATRPDLEALNEDFKKFGVELIDIDKKIGDATEAIVAATQDEFMAALGLVVSNDNTVSSGVNVKGVNDLAVFIKDLDATASTLFESDSRGVHGSVTEAIDKQLEDGVRALISNSDNKQATADLIQTVLGDRGAFIDFAAMVAETTESVEDFSDVMKAASTQLAQDIAAQEGVVSRIKSVVDRFSGARLGLSLDSNLSPLGVQARRNKAAGAFDDAFARAMSDDATEAKIGQDQLIELSKSFLTASKAYYGSSAEYLADFAKVDDALKKVETTARTELVVAEEQLLALYDIRDKMDGTAGASASSDSRNYGKNPVRNRMLASLFPEFTADFGQGQYGAFIGGLNSDDPRLATAQNIISAIGYADGGLVTGGLPGRDSVLAALMPGERVLSVDHSLMLERIAIGARPTDLTGVEMRLARIASILEEGFVRLDEQLQGVRVANEDQASNTRNEARRTRAQG